MGQIEKSFVLRLTWVNFATNFISMMTTNTDTITETVHQYRVFQRMLNAGNRSNPWRLFFSSPSEKTSQEVTMNYNKEDKDLYEYKLVDAGEATTIQVSNLF